MADYSGYSVASAGDVNGDGFDDLIIGTQGDQAAQKGAAYVVFGQAESFAANVDLSSLNGANGFQISGDALGGIRGWSVASAGDVNGDGFDDVIVGARGADSYSGAAYVVFGEAGGFAANVDVSTLNGTNGFQISGQAAYDQSGTSVASAGDVNGDGFDDLIVGAPSADPNAAYSSGASYVVFGQAAGFSANIELSALDGTNGFQVSGESAGDYSGFSVASAGDLNGDGLDDLIIGAFSDSNGYNSGASYVVFGQVGGFAANIDLSALDGINGFKISGEAAYDFGGYSAASAGDLNGDGFDDLIIGAPGADENGSASGASYVVFGQAVGFGAELDLSSLDGTDGFRINGEAELDQSGASVASAGDVNGDGFDDLIIGAFGSDPNVDYSGASYVVFGQAAGFAPSIDLSDLDGTNGFQINGEAELDQSGRSVASAGDVNNDGFDDLIIGAPRADPNGSNSGASYVVFGQAESFGAELDLSSLDGTNGFQINGGDPGAYNIIFGNSGPNVLAGGPNNDLIRGLGGDDELSGNDGNDIIFGGAGADSTSGDAGDDVLLVILDENTLEFDDNDGADIVVGYKPGVDAFDLTAVAGLASFDDLSLTASGDDVLVDYGSGTLLLTNTTLSSVEASDFLL